MERLATVFPLTDVQIKKEAFLEAVHDLLNAKEVFKPFALAEITKVLYACRISF